MSDRKRLYSATGSDIIDDSNNMNSNIVTSINPIPNGLNSNNMLVGGSPSVINTGGIQSSNMNHHLKNNTNLTTALTSNNNNNNNSSNNGNNNIMHSQFTNNTNSNNNIASNIQEDSLDDINYVIRHLSVPSDAPTNVSTQYSNDTIVGNEIQAYAKIAGCNWTYYVKHLKVSIGRNTEIHSNSNNNNNNNNNGNSSKETIDIDLGPSKVVSRKHATIEYDLNERKWQLFIRGRNGLKVNGSRLNLAIGVPFDLTSGNIIDIGGTQMMFILPDASPVIPVYFRQNILSNKKPKLAKFGTAFEHSVSPIAAFHITEGLNSIHSSDSSVESDYSKDSAKNIKPPYSYATMITQAILSNPQGILSLSEIYDWISSHFSYYRHTKQGWQNSIRHNLSLNKAFEKVPRRPNEPGKGMKWQISESYRNEFLKKWQDGTLNKLKRGTSVSRQLQLHLMKNNALPAGRSVSPPAIDEIKTNFYMNPDNSENYQSNYYTNHTPNIKINDNNNNSNNNNNNNSNNNSNSAINNNNNNNLNNPNSNLNSNENVINDKSIINNNHKIDNLHINSNNPNSNPNLKHINENLPNSSNNSNKLNDNSTYYQNIHDNKNQRSNLTSPIKNMNIPNINYMNPDPKISSNSNIQKHIFNNANTLKPPEDSLGRNYSIPPIQPNLTENSTSNALNALNSLTSPKKLYPRMDLMTPERNIQRPNLEHNSTNTPNINGNSINSSPALWNYLQFSTPLGPTNTGNGNTGNPDEKLPKLELESPLKSRSSGKIADLKDVDLVKGFEQ